MKDLSNGPNNYFTEGDLEIEDRLVEVHKNKRRYNTKAGNYVRAIFKYSVTSGQWVVAEFEEEDRYHFIPPLQSLIPETNKEIPGPCR